MIREMAEADHDMLFRQPPRLLASGDDRGWRWWLCRYDVSPDPLVGAWTSCLTSVYESRHVWMPNATPKMVRDYIASLPAPVALKARAA